MSAVGDVLKSARQYLYWWQAGESNEREQALDNLRTATQQLLIEQDYERVGILAQAQAIRAKWQAPAPTTIEGSDD